MIAFRDVVLNDPPVRLRLLKVVVVKGRFEWWGLAEDPCDLFPTRNYPLITL